MPFHALGLDAAILKAVQTSGYTEPTPIQSATIPCVLKRRNLIGIAQTGTGKTAAFTLPILSLIKTTSPPRIKALIIAPTRELVVQIEENIRTYARYLTISVVAIFGGISAKPQIQALEDGVDIVVATPGRLLDIIRGREKTFNHIEFLVLDEADRMLDMGFLPAITKIVKLLPQKRQTLFFSATLSREIEKLTKQFLHDPVIVEIGRRSNPANTVTQSLYAISHHLKPKLLLHLLQNPRMTMVLVFTRSKHGADRLTQRLEQAGITTRAMHSNRSQNQRLRSLNEFREGKIRVLVATDIAARGIDIDSISHVVNYDFPPHYEDYVHRIGRTGRAQAIGEAISFVTDEDEDAVRTLERFTRRTIPRHQSAGFDYAQQALTEKGSVLKCCLRRLPGAVHVARNATSHSRRHQQARRAGFTDSFKQSPNKHKAKLRQSYEFTPMT